MFCRFSVRPLFQVEFCLQRSIMPNGAAEANLPPGRFTGILRKQTLHIGIQYNKQLQTIFRKKSTIFKRSRMPTPLQDNSENHLHCIKNRTVRLHFSS